MLQILGGSTTKKERDVAIQRELNNLQTHISRPNVNSSQVRMLLTRGIYCEMLGYPATFLYIHAIKLAQQGSVLDKRMGYLAATVFLNDDHDLTLLLVNTILKDLKSSNVCEVSMALTASAYLANKEMVSVLLDTVEDLMHSHPKALIRKKTILTLKRLMLISPMTVHSSSITKLKKCIEDNDPEVVSTLIFTISDLVQDDLNVYKDLFEPCLAILRQILHRKFPTDYDYHSLPAPWLQIQILKLLPLLSDVGKSEVTSEILEEVLKNVDTNHTMSNAILYQCVCAVASICPHEKLLETVSTLVAKFLHSTNSDMRYVGLKALTLLVTKVHPRYASVHQELIIDSLRHPDASIRSSTFDLLICLVNASNVHLVWPKLLKHIDSTQDECVKTELILRCSRLLQTHSPSAVWTFEKSLSLVHTSPAHVQSQLCFHLKNLLNRERTNLELISVAVGKCTDILKTPVLSGELVWFCAWVLSDFSKTDLHLVLLLLAQLLKVFATNHQVQSSLLLSIKKLILSSQVCNIDPEIENLVRSCSGSSHCVVRQRCRELCQILSCQVEARRSFGHLPPSSEFDWTFSNLDEIVENALRVSSSTSPYLPSPMRTETGHLQRRSKGTVSVSSVGSFTNTRKSSISSLSGSLFSGFGLDNRERIWSKDGLRTEKPLSSPNQMTENDAAVLSKSKEDLDEDANLAKALFIRCAEQPTSEGTNSVPLDGS